MATVNPFDLLEDDDNDDPSQLMASQQQKLSTKKPAASAATAAVPPAKLPSKPLPPAQAVRELRNNNTAPVLGGTGRGGPGRGGNARGAGFVQNRDLGSWSTNAYSGGVLPEDDDTPQRRASERLNGSYGSPRQSSRGGRHGGLVNGNAEGSFDPPQRRAYERRSGSGRGFEMKREGAGRGNWGTVTDDFLVQATQKGVNLNKKAVASKKLKKKEKKKEGKTTDASKDKRDDAAKNEADEKEPKDNEMTLEVYEKVREEKRKTLLSMKAEERKVEFDKDFEAMQQLSMKKGNDDVFIKVTCDKDSKRRENAEKEEYAGKAMTTINEFLKPTERERYCSPGGRAAEHLEEETMVGVVVPGPHQLPHFN